MSGEISPRNAAIRMRSAVPALLVADVDTTAAWYATMLGFHIAGIFPDRPPSVWASVQRDGAEIMLQGLADHADADLASRRGRGTWQVYVRMTGVHRFYETLSPRSIVKRPLRRQPYGDWEFEVEDLNGYVLVFGGDEHLELPAADTGALQE
jgi:uncharacterized glyoxalase superfamily protein PhnB